MRELYQKKRFLKILLILISFAGSEALADSYQTDAAVGEVIFEVDSTLHKVRGKASQWAGKVEFDSLTGEAAVPFEIRIPVHSLNTGNEARDRAMLKMFENKRYPDIVWRVDQWSCEPALFAGTRKCLAQGSFSVHGKETRKEAEIFLKPMEDDFQTETEFKLSTRTFGLKPPSAFGVIRVADEVRIFAKTEWKKTNGKQN